MESAEKVVQLTDESFDQGISSGLTLVDFWAEWCGPCKALAPQLAQIADEYDTLTVAKLDVDANPAVSTRFEVRAIPTVILFKDGVTVEKFVGAHAGKIREMVQRAL